jgi:hypothetical protein
MSFFSSLCGCCLPMGKHPHPRSLPGVVPHNPHADFVHHGSANMHDVADIDDGYVPTVPLPRYTPHPISTDEKTIAFERRQSLASVSNLQPHEFPQDEKRPYVYESESNHPQFDGHRSPPARTDDLSSDASSTLSVPSSFGNTSTATTETPPPPYSSRPSRAPSHRSVSPSPSSHGTSMTEISLNTAPPSPVLQIPQPAYLQYHVTASDIDEGRRSWDGRRAPQQPPTYARGD